MTKKVGPGRPPVATRFRKGQSGNPKGRPRGVRARPSPFDSILDRTLEVFEGGKRRRLSIEEAMQLKTLRDAMAGKRLAQRAVLEMIHERETWFAAHAPKRTIPRWIEPVDPRNADEALGLLEIAERDGDGANKPLLLQPWAVQLALNRRGRSPLTNA